MPSDCCHTASALPLLSKAIRGSFAPSALSVSMSTAVPQDLPAGAAGFTVSSAAFVVALPAELVAMTRYCLPLSVVAVAGVVYVAAVAPAMLAQVAPLSLDSCHCKLGVGTPLAATVKVAAAGAVTVCAVGCVVMAGACDAGFTLSVTALLVTLPLALLAMTR